MIVIFGIVRYISVNLTNRLLDQQIHSVKAMKKYKKHGSSGIIQKVKVNDTIVSENRRGIERKF